MKIDRLIGILAILLQKDGVTAPYLAELFEVSRRTINRDIEELCMAGIPIVTRQGVHGGISIIKDYKIAHTLLTYSEMQDILAGLRSLDSIHGSNRYSQLMEKLMAGASDFMTGNQSVLIDLTSWYKNSIVPKIEMIRNAIDQCFELKFFYYSPKGESVRVIEPYYLIFRWSSWYVWGWCKEKEDFRLFKLNRMDQLVISEEVFEKRTVHMPDLSNESIFPNVIQVKAFFDKQCKWRLIEEFGVGCFVEASDGKLLFQVEHTDDENLIIWLLTFRDKVELLEPVYIRERLYQELSNTLRIYQERKE